MTERTTDLPAGSAGIRAKIEELQRELKVLLEHEREERESRIRSIPRMWRFTLTPAPVTSFLNDRMLPDSGVILIRLAGVVINKDEFAGVLDPTSDHLAGGGMSYFYNTLNHRFVCDTGGGHIFVASGTYAVATHTETREDFLRVFAELGEFMRKHPKGGDVTSIILSQRHFAWK